MSSATDMERLNDAYERGIELAENFDYEYENLVGVMHGGHHVEMDGHPIHWVEAAVEIEISRDTFDDGDLYADETVRILITEARDLGLDVSMVTVKVGYEAQSYRTKPDPSGTPFEAGVDALVVIEFGLSDEDW